MNKVNDINIFFLKSLDTFQKLGLEWNLL